jgi:Domain of unknown function (DUF4397)
MRNILKTFCAMVSLAVIAAICGCANITEGYVRVVQVSSVSPILRVTVGGEVVDAFSLFPSYTKYVPVEPGTALPVDFYNANSDPTVILTTTVNVTTNADTTIFVMNKGAGLQAIVYPETNNSFPATGNFKLRAVQAASAEPALDVYVTAPGADLTKSRPVLANVAFGAVTQYLTLSAGTYQIRMTPVNTPGTVIIDSGPATFFSGQILSSIAANGTTPGTFGLMVTDDTPPAI